MEKDERSTLLTTISRLLKQSLQDVRILRRAELFVLAERETMLIPNFRSLRMGIEQLEERRRPSHSVLRTIASMTRLGFG